MPFAARNKDTANFKDASDFLYLERADSDRYADALISQTDLGKHP